MTTMFFLTASNLAGYDLRRLAKISGSSFILISSSEIIVVTDRTFLKFLFGKCAVCSNSMLDFHSAGDL